MTAIRITTLGGAVLLCAITANAYAGGAEPVQQAQQNLAERLSVEPQDIEVVSREEVTWPDGSLGCPQPGMMYRQVLSNGSRLILRAQGREYHYHAAAGAAYRYCAKPSTVASGGDNDLSI